jgi:GntR family transcriptional regulator
MYDVVHPSIALPEVAELQLEVQQGRMVLDVLIDIGIPVTYARTRVMPAVLTARERAGKLLGITGTTAGLELEELIFAGRDDRVAYSRDLFAPGGIEVMVMRSLDSPRPARVAGKVGGKAAGARSAANGRGARGPGRASDR